MLLEIDWQGAAQVRARDAEAITIQILPPSLEALEHRLQGRGQDDEASIAERMGGARRELSHYPDFDYLVLNDWFDDALDEIEAIIRAERARTNARAQAPSARSSNTFFRKAGVTAPLIANVRALGAAFDRYRHRSTLEAKRKRPQGAYRADRASGPPRVHESRPSRSDRR